jgi:hypothetical protein
VSTLSAVLIVAALLAFSLAGGYWQIGRARQACEDERARAIEAGRISGSFAPVVHGTVPDDVRLIEDIEGHLKAYGAAVADLYDTTPGD